MNRCRNFFISVFVILWCLAFHYESARHFYLEPLAKRPLPKIKFLFPPAGWIMFFRVDEAYGHLRVFGFKDGQSFEVDPHEVFRVRTIGFDNIHRGIMGAAASRRNSGAFCKQLYSRFEYFDSFRILYDYYPNFVTEPAKRYQQIFYSCSE